MKVLLVEDEKLAADRLSHLLHKLDPTVEVIGRIESVRKTVDWLQNKEEPDLLFIDIQLADGLSFEIFDKVKVNTPIIFTTAYDEYAIKAFKVNSIDYLLKPIDEEDLKIALTKFGNWKPVLDNGNGLPAAVSSEKLETLLKMLGRAYKERFVVKVGDHLKSIEVKDTDFFVSLEKATFLQHKDGKRYLIDFTLDQVETLVDPGCFFRINRKYLVAYTAISDIIAWSNSRLRLVLHQCKDGEVIVAREKVNAFKDWLDR